MNTFEYANPNAKITAKHGLITCQTNGKPVIIREQPLAVFEAFYRDWQHALALIANESFIEGWTNNEAAQTLLRLALETLGVSNEQIDSLTFRQLQLLLIADGNGGAGLIFQLHNTFPKPLKSANQKITLNYWKTFISLLPTLTTYYRQEYMCNVGLVRKIFAQFGLFLASCTIWLLKSISTYLVAPRNKKP